MGAGDDSAAREACEPVAAGGAAARLRGARRALAGAAPRAVRVALRSWIASLGRRAVAYALIDAALTSHVPRARAHRGRAALFGLVVGLAVVLFASNVASVGCFLIARYVARDSVAALVGRREEYKRIDALVAKRGAAAVALVRLIPLSPFEFVSYAFGLTAVPFRTYALWTAVGSFPGAVLYVFGSSTIIETAATGRVPAGLVAVFAAVLVVVVLIARKVAADLRE